MSASWSFEGQICLDGFESVSDLRAYIESNDGVVKVTLYHGNKMVLVVRPVKPLEVPF